MHASIYFSITMSVDEFGRMFNARLNLLCLLRWMVSVTGLVYRERGTSIHPSIGSKAMNDGDGGGDSPFICTQMRRHANSFTPLSVVVGGHLKNIISTRIERSKQTIIMIPPSSFVSISIKEGLLLLYLPNFNVWIARGSDWSG